MTMHLEGPWLSMTGKKKGKQKFRNAEAARQARENEEAWKQKQKEWVEMSAARAQARATAAKPLRFGINPPRAGSTTAHIPSRDTGIGNALAPEAKVYTGTAMKGIGTMHKSNSVPIFSDEEAIAIAHMRR